MGRSVCYLNDAEAVVFIDFDGMYRQDECFECEGTGAQHWLDGHPWPKDFIGPRNACDVCEGSGDNPHPETDEHDWDSFMDNLADRIGDRYPSMYEANEWPEREVRAFLANDHAIVAVSEYCGLVSVSLRSKDGDWDDAEAGLHKAWTKQVAAGFVKHLTDVYGEYALVKVGVMSNGSGVYKKAIAA